MRTLPHHGRTLVLLGILMGLAAGLVGVVVLNCAELLLVTSSSSADTSALYTTEPPLTASGIVVDAQCTHALPRPLSHGPTVVVRNGDLSLVTLLHPAGDCRYAWTVTIPGGAGDLYSVQIPSVFYGVVVYYSRDILEIGSDEGIMSF